MTQLPEWANWLARDKDGRLWALDVRPYKNYPMGEWTTFNPFNPPNKSVEVTEEGKLYAHIKWTDEEPTPVQSISQMFEKGIQAKAHGYDEIPSMVDKPKHYQNKSGKDLFQIWHERYDFDTFREVMRCIAERYTLRYENKNGFEDLDKGIYTLQRLREYEEMEK